MKKRKVLAMFVGICHDVFVGSLWKFWGETTIRQNSDADTESGSDEDAIPDNEITGDPSAKDCFCCLGVEHRFYDLAGPISRKIPDLKDRWYL